MKLTSPSLVVLFAAMLSIAWPFAAQEPGATPAGSAQTPAMPSMPSPGPAQEIFRMDEGTWDAKVEVFAGPGATPMVSTGVETNIIGCNGLCLITDFKGEMMPGATFHGHGVSMYDVARKKYVGSWADSMSGGLAISEGTYDPGTKSVTGWMQGTDASGNVTKMKSVGEYKGAGSRLFTMYVPGPDGKEVPNMRITYTKKP